MKLNSSRRRLIGGLLSMLAFATTADVALAKDDYPDRPIRLVVAYPPGGPLDILARALSQPLGVALGQPIIVENRAGAGGVIGSERVARSAPDGYTLLFGSTPLSIQETLLDNLPYSALTDFTPIAEMAAGPQVLVVAKSVPVNTVREFIDYAKAHDGQLNYASPSAGGSNHLAAEMFKTMAGFSATHVPYKGGAPAEIALMSGEVSFMFGAFNNSLAQSKKGLIKVLGVSSPKRMAIAPDVPAISETLPGFEVLSWYGVLGPAHMPAAITSRLNAEINKILVSESMKKLFAAMGLEATVKTPEQFGTYIHGNTAMWARVIKEAHVTLE